MSRTLPRVTEILRAVGLGPDLSGIPAHLLEGGQKRGRAVHDAIEAIAYGYDDGSLLDPEVEPRIVAYRRFVEESGHQPIASELLVVHPTWDYCGHLDRLGWLVGRRGIFDWKSGEVDLEAAALQLAGYRAAYNAEHPSELVELTAVVELRSDGTYRYHDIAAADYETDFFAAVTVYRAQQRRRATGGLNG